MISPVESTANKWYNIEYHEEEDTENTNQSKVEKETVFAIYVIRSK